MELPLHWRASSGGEFRLMNYRCWRTEPLVQEETAWSSPTLDGFLRRGVQAHELQMLENRAIGTGRDRMEL
ncbi:hypothetical protein LEMLEM_LOCUS20110, partial [Lemmus lemmus]